MSLKELAQERWAFTDPNLVSQRWLLDKFREADLPPPHITFESRALALKQRTVACSDLLTFVSRSVFEQTLPSKVKTLPVKQLIWPWPVSVIYRNETSLPPVVRRFVDIIKTVAKTIHTLR